MYGLFWEKQEGRWLVTKARGEMKVAELYERQEIKFEGFTPAQEPDTLKKLREECGKDLVVAGELVKFSPLPIRPLPSVFLRPLSPSPPLPARPRSRFAFSLLNKRKLLHAVIK